MASDHDDSALWPIIESRLERQESRIDYLATETAAIARIMARLETKIETLEDRAADDAAEKAVQRVFAAIGVDINDPKDIRSFREDLSFNTSARAYTRLGVTALFTAFLSGVGAACWYYLTYVFTGKSH